ncbi:hypothetical protein BV898_04279 [Hypsibius exemplaris]|uniref:X-box-binding protein 1 n=1 Tax=Hypsibius exemplaris TaxID=2072580 RepID=A0A1W0X2T0_HYPEX|nr:hypothetical protein BV898_04279 [Hypsibius exemplaris]
MVPSLAVRKKEVVVVRAAFTHEPSPSPSLSSLASSTSGRANGNGKRKSPEDDQENGSDRDKKRKLMNRVAAQQSRDRKRLYMDNLEKEIKKLKAENALLKSTNLTIQEEKDRLLSENVVLKTQTVLEIKHEEPQSVPEISSSVTFESAAFISAPLQKDQVTMGLVFWLMQFLQILNPNSQMSSSVSSKRFGKISVEALIQRHLQSSQRCGTRRLLEKWLDPVHQTWNPSKISFSSEQSLSLPS